MKPVSKSKINLVVRVIGSFLVVCMIYGAYASINRLKKEDLELEKHNELELVAVSIKPKEVIEPVLQNPTEQNQITEETISIAQNVTLEEAPEEIRQVVYDNMTMEELSAKLDRSLNSNLAGKGSIFAQACMEYGVDPYLALAIVLEETGCKWNCSNLVKQCNNVGGQKGGTIKCNGGVYRYYPTLEEGIYGFVDNLAQNYYAKGLTTPEQMNTKYATSLTWSTKINRYIEVIKNS